MRMSSTREQLEKYGAIFDMTEKSLRLYNSQLSLSVCLSIIVRFQIVGRGASLAPFFFFFFTFYMLAPFLSIVTDRP